MGALGTAESDLNPKRTFEIPMSQSNPIQEPFGHSHSGFVALLNREWPIVAATRLGVGLIFCCTLTASAIAGDEVDETLSAATAAAESAEVKQARDTAVALNYCRTSFHRIRRYPSKRVLLEEQQKILNNLNLNGIADEEVVKLYTAVLQEIAEVQIAEREREVINKRHQRVFYRQLSLTAFDLTTQLATAHYAAAVRTGAASWWDFRAMGWQTELDTWKLEKEQLVAVTDKSALFLDTFWKLARRRNIPDRWLVRSTDLDRLETAVREPDLEVRLRVLKRMEKFMECYPPYWYYVGRTQQQLGQLFAATETYQMLVKQGEGHFRKDEMLAAGTVNQAVIQDYLKQPSADKTALQALKFSTDVWEVNLLGADVLRRRGKFAEAEDAVLRNLDVELEKPQSHALLLAIYYDWKQKEQLTAQLASLDVIRQVPIPVLLQTARLLADDRLPAPLVRYIGGSLRADIDLGFGRDDVEFAALPQWQLSSAQTSLVVDGQTFDKPRVSSVRNQQEVRFRRVLELGSPLKSANEKPQLVLAIDYPDGLEVHVHLRHGQPDTPPDGRVPDRYDITRIDVAGTSLWLMPSARPADLPVDSLPSQERTDQPMPDKPVDSPQTDAKPLPLLVPPDDSNVESLPVPKAGARPR